MNEIESPQLDVIPAKALLSVPEVATVLGLGRTVTYRLVLEGTIHSCKVPGTRCRRIPREGLIAWIKTLG
ncbi:MAG: helix-turn-helix domain-containing protein [Armatimonadetes bacterium]|nr:helix-turn-helix domain-containing protein [Armatimonadota bacterium]